MNSHEINATTRGFAVSLAVTSVVSGLLVFLKELNEGVMNFMKAVTIHHWVTHALFTMVLFLVLGYLLGRSHDGQGPDLDDDSTLKVVLGGVAAGIALILVFYGFVD